MRVEGAYGSTQLNKERAKVFYDKCIYRKEFSPRQEVLLYDFGLHLFSEKHRPRWPSPFIVVKIYLHGAIKIKVPTKDYTFKVNGNKLKHFLEMPSKGDV